ncbi:MAG: M48 family metallopeptidase, partial [Acidobacteria bacterium]|nr:M48 family metallopeptidase [Acidobacteriota bacterium]
MTTYRVSDYLETYEENRRQIDQGVRERLLKEGIRLSERLSPRIYRVFKDLCQALELEAQAEVFCLPSNEINAFAMLDVRKDITYSLIGVTAPALERLEDAELKSILGHELGHILFGNNRLAALISTDANNPSVTVLPALGESLYLRWRKKAEISADRVSVLASRDFRATATSLLKATFGLSERNLNLDVEALVNQVDEIRGRPELMEEVFASHPLLPIRLKAVELFSRSAKAMRAGYPVEGPTIGDDELENAVDDLVKLTRRYPFQPLHQAIMRAVALGGALLLSADKDVSDEEVKILVQILHRWFTDEPESEIVTDREEIMRKLPEAIEVIRKLRASSVGSGDGDQPPAKSEPVPAASEVLTEPPKRPRRADFYRDGIPDEESYDAAMDQYEVQKDAFTRDQSLSAVEDRAVAEAVATIPTYLYKDEIKDNTEDVVLAVRGYAWSDGEQPTPEKIKAAAQRVTSLLDNAHRRKTVVLTKEAEQHRAKDAPAGAGG